MSWAKQETINRLFDAACGMPVVDAHTHVQDDLTAFDSRMASQNLAGTQASINAYPQHLVDAALGRGRLVRRTMMDVAHGCFYSWFAQIIEGRRGRLDSIIAEIGENSESDRRRVGELLIRELQASRHSEYAEWLRYMFRLYDVELDAVDPLDPAQFDAVYAAVAARRGDPEFAAQVLADHRIAGYVTSIENRDRVPLVAGSARVGDVDLGHATHPEAFNMFDAHYLIWPEGATDFELFLAGHKYEGAEFLINLEQMLDTTIAGAGDLKAAVGELLTAVLFSPTHNPESRVRYTNLFQPIDIRLSDGYQPTEVEAAIRHRKGKLSASDLRQLCAVAMEAMLETLDEIGSDLKRAGGAGRGRGSCLQIAIGATYFMDHEREVQSLPVYAPGFPQAEFAVWSRYPDVHFEYIVAHGQLYDDLANAAKQVANVSVGPWWHFFRKHKIAGMLHDQLDETVDAIASGFTDARFAEMLAAKYQSIRYAIATALAEFVDDPSSSMDTAAAIETTRQILFTNPIEFHHLPIDS